MDDKNSNKNDKEETRLDRMKYDYMHDKTYREGVNAFFYVMFFFVLIIAVIITFDVNTSSKKNNSKTSEDIKSEEVKSYKDLLDGLLNNSKFKININNSNAIITGEYGNNILTGTLEDASGTYNYKIKDNIIYEVRLSNEIESDNLFLLYDMNFIDPSKLVLILESNPSIKTKEKDIIKYTYNNIISNNIKYNIVLSINNNKITNIDIVSDNNTYNISYE